MKNYWTSKEPINGLRHFVLLSNTKENHHNILMVSVLDSEISIRISKSELMNKAKWQAGWLDFPKEESITDDYLKFKLSNKNKKVENKIFVSDNSLFNIS